MSTVRPARQCLPISDRRGLRWTRAPDKSLLGGAAEDIDGIDYDPNPPSQKDCMMHVVNIRVGTWISRVHVV